ncbi:MAG: CDP-alcohol phosphatidyltransferase family protein [Thermoprotei archaeon]|nr:MAG: CDP-alcohol phosphatidyltransferase family protein [Thermoprotei archaeon]RLF25315.1 MAG: CDP-alcohol phosphatidyltransferase family protein [Thermoprotei archaeon]
MLGRFREEYEKRMMPLGRALAALGISPNLMTFISLLISILCMFTLWRGDLMLSTMLLLLVGFTDMLDGSIARALGKTSRFGGVLDHVVDRYAEFFIMMGLGIGNIVRWEWIIFSLFGMIMASYTRAKAESIGGLRSCTVGIAERQEKLLLLMIGLLLHHYGLVDLNHVVILIGVLSHITVLQRLEYTRRHTTT